ncbi:hypothetical protein GCM10015536_34890 [Streptomyces griseomycini]|nr:hypothetical protein GCM10015536_34890 [Streptomyces griseomycini]
MYGPVTGAGSPLAPPVRATPADGGFVGRRDPGIAHERPPGYGHGEGSRPTSDSSSGAVCASDGLRPATGSARAMRERTARHRAA